MAAITMDHLSGGRFILGLGVSGPQVVEGWYGEPFAKPLARTREYVSIVRDVIARPRAGRARMAPHYPLPVERARGDHGPRQAAEDDRPSVARSDPDLPRRRGPQEHRPDRRDRGRLARAVLLARTITTSSTGRIWRRVSRGADGRRDDFEIAVSLDFIVDDDVERAADMIRPRLALYFGGMGARSMNFHHEVAVRMGYGAEARKIQELFLEGKKDEAAAAVPTKLVEQLSLIGPADKIRHDLEAWRDSGVTSLLIVGRPELLRQAAEIVLGLAARSHGGSTDTPARRPRDRDGRRQRRDVRAHARGPRRRRDQGRAAGWRSLARRGAAARRRQPALSRCATRASGAS